MIKRLLLYGVLVLVVLVAIVGISNSKNDNNGGFNAIEKTKTDLTKAEVLPTTDSRSFYMALGSWPGDATVDAVNDLYEIIDAHADMVFHHFDNGVPWQEAFDGTTFSEHLEGDWRWKRAKTPADTKIYLGITPLNFNRDDMVGYWGETDNMPLTGVWKEVRLNDEKVKKAYLNYARRAVEYFNPSYLSIGSEVNILSAKDRAKWKDYLELNAYVYAELKEEYPNLPIFSSVQYEWLRGAEEETKNKKAEQLADVKELLKASDVIALTVYKYGTLHNPITDDYFGLAKSLESKPIGIAEMGAMSKDAKFNGTTLTANEDDQNKFVNFMLESATKEKFVFVNNYFPVDFDKLLKRLSQEMQSVSTAWAHMGLFDKNLNPKQALTTWDAYLKLPLEK